MTYFDLFQNHFKIILPEFFFLSTILIILIYGTLYNASVYYKYPVLSHSVGGLSIQSLCITLFLIVNSFNTGPSSVVIFNNVLIMDDFTLFVKTVVLIGSIATIFMSFNYTLNQKMSARINEYMVLILFSTLSMLLIISSFDLISMYLAIELQSLAFYVLAAFQRNNEFSTEAGLKYFILGALASGLLLFGESLIYGFTGLTNFEELTKLISVLPDTYSNTFIATQDLPFITTWLPFLHLTYIEIIIIGLFFILVAFLFKISAVPFHLWTPDVYEGAPTTVTAFFSIAPKIAILALLLRLCMYTFYDLIDSWQYLIIFSSFLSMFIGTLGAIKQNKLKRLLAYSSIAHVGYLLISLATGTIESIEALLIYAVLYTLTIINVFSILLVMSRENFNLNEYENLIPVNYQPTPNYLNSMLFKGGLDCEDTNSKSTNMPGHQAMDLNINNAGPENLTSLTKGQNKLFAHNLCFSSSKLKMFQKIYPNLQTKESSRTIQYTNLIKGNPLWDPYLTASSGGAQTNFASLPGACAKGVLLNSVNVKEKKNTYIKHLTDLSSLSKTNPILALTAAIIFFSNAGIPPLAGFYGKLNVFLAAVENSMYFLAISGILCSVIGTFYSIRLVKIIYYHSMSNNTWHFYQPIGKENAIVLALTFFFTLFFFLSPSFLFITAHSAALSLCI